MMKLYRTRRHTWAWGFCINLLTLAAADNTRAQPNIVYILADDMGLGDVRSYTPNSPVDTPNIDALATDGMRFTNAHSPSAVCTPTRYGVLTGTYSWRTSLQSNVLLPHDAPLIDPGTQTVANLLRAQGYDTSIFGKWHLGMDWVTTDGLPAEAQGGNVDYAQPFTGGPIDHGFDTYFGDDVINYPPYAFIEDDQVQGTPSIFLPNATARRPGLAVPGYEQVDSLPNTINRAVQYIGDRAGNSAPFFMYLPLSAPHAPIVPPGFIPNVGTEYDRFISTVDWAVGEVMDELASQGIDDETMIIFTADNGVAKSFATSDNISPGFIDGTPLRGQKADIWEGGHRVPMIVRWDGQVQAGSTSDQYVELNDFFATTADLIDADPDTGAAVDSVSMLPELLGHAGAEGLRTAGVNHSFHGAFAIRQFDESGTEWKLIFTNGSGGFSGPVGTKVNPNAIINDYTALQLYNMTADVGESNNLLADGVSSAERARVDQMHALLRHYITSGSSTGAGVPGGPVTLAHTADARLFNPGDSRGDNNGGGDVNLIGAGTNGIENFALYQFDLGSLTGQDIEGDVTLTVTATLNSNSPQNSGGSDDTITVHEVFRTNTGWNEGTEVLAFVDRLTDDGSVSFKNRVQYNDDPGPPSGTTLAWKDDAGNDVADLLGAISGALGTAQGFSSSTATLLFTIPQATFQDWVDNGLAGLVFRAQEGGGATPGARFVVTGATFQVAIAALLGDADGDGDIDDTDLGIAISNFTGPIGAAGGKSAAQGDTDGDGDVDDTDLGVSISGYTGPLAPQSVPEPGSLTLLAVAGFAARRR